MDNKVDCGSDPSILPDAYTAIIWSKWGSTSDNYLMAFGGAVDGNNGLGVYLGRPYLFLNSNGNWAYFSLAAGAVVRDGGWHQSAFMLAGAGQNDALTARFNLDGVEIALAGTRVTHAQIAKSGLRIGNRRFYNYFDGLIALVLLYNRVLAADEVRWNRVNYHNPVRDGLVLWLPMEEGAGLTAYDKSGLGNDGSLLPGAGPPIWERVRQWELRAVS